jgi:Fur family peroxide stress response transcriptional regulator
MSSEKPLPDRIRIFKKICNKLGLKVTHQRLEIYNDLSSARDHPSAEEVFKRIKRRLPTISFDTVYRTLALFERYRIITRVSKVDDRTRYDSNMESHYHLICTQCKKIQDFFWSGLNHLALPVETEEWGVIEDRYMEFRGICRKCLEKEKSSQLKNK